MLIYINENFDIPTTPEFILSLTTILPKSSCSFILNHYTVSKSSTAIILEFSIQKDNFTSKLEVNYEVTPNVYDILIKGNYQIARRHILRALALEDTQLSIKEILNDLEDE